MKVEMHSKDVDFGCSFESLSWDTPSCELFSKSILIHLRDDHPSEILEQIEVYDIHVKANVAVEIAFHGNWQKAAFILRELYEKADEKDKIEICKHFGNLSMAEALLTENILLLPRKTEQVSKYLYKKFVLGRVKVTE